MKMFVSLLNTILLMCALASARGYFFLENFDTDPFEQGRWAKSMDEKYSSQLLMVRPSSKASTGFDTDNGLVLAEDMKYYAAYSKFSSPLVTAGKDLVIQYELKLEEKLACGGAYVKLPRVSEDKLSTINNETPYTIMFGPDKCGGDSRVHFILQHQSPVTNEWEEKHFNGTIPMRSDGKTHLYTLHISNDNSFKIYVDSAIVQAGNLLTHMKPAINPPKEIDDPSDIKPSDWVDEEHIPDPEAIKPDDWDDDAPPQIPNPEAKKPDSWLDYAPENIPDPKATKPADWDDEEDGVWEAPTIINPDCELFGCGVWEAPMIRNPNFRGKWKPPMVANPKFIGKWAPRKIPNPNLFEDKTPAATMAPMTALALEIWTTNGGLFFDNFLITDSLSEAQSYAANTFKLKSISEDQEEHDKKKQQQRMIDAQGGFRGAVVKYAGMAMEFFIAPENFYVSVATMVAILVPFLYALVGVFLGKTPKTIEEIGKTPSTEVDNSSHENSNAKNTTTENVSTGDEKDDSTADSNK